MNTAGNVVVTTDQVPAASYIVSAKAAFKNTSGAPTTLTCVLQGGGSTIDSATVDATDGSQTLALLGVVTLGSPATVALFCSTSAGDVLVSDMQLVAMSVSSITFSGGVGF